MDPSSSANALSLVAFQHPRPMGYYPQFPEVIPHLRVGYPCSTEPYAMVTLAGTIRLAWLNRIPIAVASGRVNQNLEVLGKQSAYVRRRVHGDPEIFASISVAQFRNV